MTIVGGLRTRFISDSVRIAIVAALSGLGWFDADREHLPLRFSPKPADWDDNVRWNTFSITAEGRDEYPSELGGRVVDDTTTFFVDFYAESHAVGQHFASDVAAIVAGRMPEVGRRDDVFDIYDLRLVNPVPFLQVIVERCAQDRAILTPRPWQQFWYYVRFDILDDHADEYGESTGVLSGWNAPFSAARAMIRTALEAA